MPPADDPTTSTPSSLSQRRPAAQSLGGMTLPTPMPYRTQPFGASKRYAYATDSTPPSSVMNSGNLLTPPTTMANDSVSPISSIVNSINSAAANNVQQLPSFTAQDQWQPTGPTGTTPYSMGTGTTPQLWSQTLKGLFSPSLPGSYRATMTPDSSGLPLPPPPPHISAYDGDPMSNFSQSVPPVHPDVLAANNASYHQNVQISMAQAPTPRTTTVTMSPPVSTSQSSFTPPSLTASRQSLMERSASTPNGYSYPSLSQPTSTQTTSFPTYNPTSSPSQQGPFSAPLMGGSTSLSSPSVLSPHVFQQQQSSSAMTYGFRDYPVGQYPLPNGPAQIPMVGPVFSNMGYPPAPHMTLTGVHNGVPMGIPGYHSGTSAQMFGQGIPNDRPYKCDQCPQSFNRNHDLKRHKRIHLAVKPFPCQFCDKSFSRKDALKRHVLVKGCGKGHPARRSPRKSVSQSQSQSPKEESSDYKESSLECEGNEGSVKAEPRR